MKKRLEGEEKSDQEKDSNFSLTLEEANRIIDEKLKDIEKTYVILNKPGASSTKVREKIKDFIVKSSVNNKLINLSKNSQSEAWHLYHKIIDEIEKVAGDKEKTLEVIKDFRKLNYPSVFLNVAELYKLCEKYEVGINVEEYNIEIENIAWKKD